MAFDGTEGTFITITEGETLTQKYRDDFLSGNVERKAVFFGKDKLQILLDQSNCEGIRCYFGAVEKTNGTDTWTELDLVLVGADALENDQIGVGHNILDAGSPCPPECGSANALNS